MKIVFILVFTSFTSVIASDLSEYERHYQELNKLRGQLEKLELEKKIQEIRADIKKVKRESSASAIASSSISGGFNQPPPSVSASIASSSRLMYIIGAGKDARAVIDFNGSTKTVRDNDTVDGWKVKIIGKKVKLSKGKNTVEL